MGCHIPYKSLKIVELEQPAWRDWVHFCCCVWLILATF